MPSGPQWTVWGREYPVFLKTSSGSMILWIFACGGMGLRIDDVNAGGADARDNQIAPLKEGVAGKRRQGRRAGVPAEVVKLVPLVGHRDRVNDLAKVGEPGFTSITASASDFEKSGLSSKI